MDYSNLISAKQAPTEPEAPHDYMTQTALGQTLPQHMREKDGPGVLVTKQKYIFLFYLLQILLKPHLI